MPCVDGGDDDGAVVARLHPGSGDIVPSLLEEVGRRTAALRQAWAELAEERSTVKVREASACAGIWFGVYDIVTLCGVIARKLVHVFGAAYTLLETPL